VRNRPGKRLGQWGSALAKSRVYDVVRLPLQRATGAFDNDVRLKSDAGNGARVVGCPEGAHQIRLASRLSAIEYMDVQSALFAEHSG
jgi:hypothetical protein